MSNAERARVLEVLNSQRFADMAPAQVYATLLDEGVYLCSESTMYRILREKNQTGDRRRQATHLVPPVSTMGPAGPPAKTQRFESDSSTR
ncbi:hypothetical protein [Rhodococcus koreensis]